jgi:hypothetical protein
MQLNLVLCTLECVYTHLYTRGNPDSGFDGYVVLNPGYSSTASNFNNGAGAVDCDSRRAAVGPIRTTRGVFMTQLNRLERLAILSAPNAGWSF